MKIIFDDHYLKSAPQEDIKITLKACAEDRTVHRFHRKGYSNDKGKTMRKIGSLPAWFRYKPEVRDYLDDPTLSVEERRKRFYKIYETYTKWKAYD